MQANHPERIFQSFENAKKKLQEVEDIFIQNEAFHLLDEVRNLLQSVKDTSNFIQFINSGEKE